MIGFIIKVNPPHQVAAEGENVKFECTVNSTLNFTIKWMNSTNGTLEDSMLNKSVNGTVTLTLSLINVKREDYQSYTCSGRDDEITVNASAILSKLTSQNIG